jgi:hypothetical protein
MRQCLHKDWFQLGSYFDGARNTTGSWRALSSAEVPVYPQLVDAGAVYASKDLAMKDGAHHTHSSTSNSTFSATRPHTDAYIPAMMLQ